MSFDFNEEFVKILRLDRPTCKQGYGFGFDLEPLPIESG
jgi:hypothetical protein